MISKEFVNPHPMGFSNAVTYTAQGVKTILVSGQVGYEDGRFGDSFEEQADMAHRNLAKELQAAGATVEDVVKLNTYIVDLDSGRSKVAGQAKAQVFVQANQPASTVVGVSSLVMKQLLIEVEATAVVEV